MLQPAFSDCLYFDLLSHFQNLWTSAVIDVGGCQVAQALVVAVVVVVIDECADLTFEIPGQEVVFQENPVLHGLMPPFDLSLGLGVMWCTPHMIHAFALKIVGKIGGDVGRTIIAEQPWLLHYRCV